MNITQFQIEQLLQNEDIEGLIEAGAPNDEYESEAQTIFQALEKLPKEQINDSNIAAIIMQIWQENFNLSDEDIIMRLEHLQSISRNIFQNW